MAGRSRAAAWCIVRKVVKMPLAALSISARSRSCCVGIGMSVQPEHEIDASKIAEAIPRRLENLPPGFDVLRLAVRTDLPELLLAKTLHRRVGAERQRKAERIAKHRCSRLVRYRAVHLCSVLRGIQHSAREDKRIGASNTVQPIYITLSSSGSSPWRQTNWHCIGPMNIGVSVVGNSTSTWQLDYTVDDPTGAYPNPTLGASAPTVFSSLNGSSTPTYGAFTTPVAAIRLTMNARSSVGGQVVATILQAGIG